jgi:hypothetical protein
MSDKRKSTSPSAIFVKNRQKTIGIEDKLHVISRHEKGERIVHICRNVRLVHSSVRTICDTADSIKESAKSGTKVFVCVARLSQSYLNEPYQKTMDVSLLHFYCIRNKYIYCIEMYVYYIEIYTVYLQYMYTLQGRISTSGLVIHYKGWGCQFR